MKVHFFVGILQLLTSLTFLYIGWLWSIAWGVLIFLNGSHNVAGEGNQQLSSERPLNLDPLPKGVKGFR